MKKSFFKWASLSMASLLILAFLGLPAALAAVANPEIDEVLSPVDATKAVITGSTDPDYKIIVTGGPYEIAPVYADEKGKFEITVALAQESLNTFYIKAENTSGETSELVEVSIMESSELAEEAEASGGGDHTAPAAPILDETPETLDADEYIFNGTGEVGATIRVSGDREEEKKISNDGTFEIKLTLDQNAKNNFSFTVVDGAGNVSPSTKVTLTEESSTQVVVNEEGEIEIVLTDEDGNLETITLTDIYGHWAENYILELVQNKVMQGYDDGTFRPDQSMNRAEFTKTVLEALGYSIPDTITSSDFSDVPVNEWYAPYTQTAKERNIIAGYEDGTFRPNNNITRAEAIKILLQAANIEIEIPAETIFSDVDLNEWYAPYVVKAHSMGIVSGYDDGRFGVNDPITRGQVTKIIVELLKQL
ncbi:MAG: Ig-like, group 2 [uncultured bacterium]|nr:MAG: Ig-like, group 2 [uncultured bacterium]KKT73672.1 MAG: Beta-1,4-xylanase [Candidatus Peregrinibacteria bacterium GW2011_GWA2_44_7]